MGGQLAGQEVSSNWENIFQLFCFLRNNGRDMGLGPSGESVLRVVCSQAAGAKCRGEKKKSKILGAGLT